MHRTPSSLLDRLRRPNEEAAWAEFVELYTPLIYHWARRTNLSHADAADLVQDVLTVLIRKLPEFTYDRTKSFRGWLRTITVNRWRDQQRRRIPVPAADLELLEIPVADSADAFDDAEYHKYLARRALELAQKHFEPVTWKACWELVVAGRPAREVAAELGISEGAAYVARCRVLQRLRTELAGLLD